MIIVDNIAENFCRQPRNGIEIATWTGNEHEGISFDVELRYLQRLLLNMVQSKPADLRDKLDQLKSSGLLQNQNIQTSCCSATVKELRTVPAALAEDGGHSSSDQLMAVSCNQPTMRQSAARPCSNKTLSMLIEERTQEEASMTLNYRCAPGEGRYTTNSCSN